MFDTPVRIDIPLPDNSPTGFSCGEVALSAALKYLVPEQETPSREQLERLTRKLPDHNTWPEELARVEELHPELTATIFRTHPITGPAADYIRRHYGPTNEHIVAETNLPSLEAAIIECETKGRYRIGAFDLESLLRHVTATAVVIGWFDINVLYEYETDTFQPHYDIVTGYDLDCVSVHESGNAHTLPVAHQRIGHQRFMKALGPTPNFLVIERAPGKSWPAAI